MQADEPISWNFEKFLVDKSGNVIHRYAPKEGIDKETKKPTSHLIKKIDEALKQKPHE